MKRLLLLFALVAFAACQTETPEPQPQPEPEPQPEVKEPKLTLTSESILEFEAAGGEGAITYTLENSVEGRVHASTVPVLMQVSVLDLNAYCCL